MVRDSEVLIVGGGPAGCALAFLLARRGVQVVLVDHGRAHHSGPFETLLAPAHRLLERTGLRDLVLPNASPDPLRHGALWGSDELVWRDDDAPGLLLQRGPFDRGLREAAAAAGADVRCPARAERTADGVVRVVGDRGEERLRPRCLVVATGRTRSPWAADRVPVRAGPGTTALAWVGEPAADDRGTAFVEAVPDGWIWSHAPAVGMASAAVLLDAEAIAARGAGAVLRAALATARGPAARLRGASVRHAANATPRLLRTDGEALLLGDAASCIDPLASQGVEKALAAADHAAAAIATAVRTPAWWPRLRALHARWEAGLFAGHAAAAAQWYAREARFADASFWRRRRPTTATAGADVGWDTVLAPCPTLRWQPVLVRQGAAFVETDGVADAATGDELAQVGYVSVRPLLELFTRPATLRDAVVAAGRDGRLHVLSPNAVHTGLRALITRGWLSAAGNAASTR